MRDIDKQILSEMVDFGGVGAELRYIFAGSATPAIAMRRSIRRVSVPVL
jgi:hypothetical protein